MKKAFFNAGLLLAVLAWTGCSEDSNQTVPPVHVAWKDSTLLQETQYLLPEETKKIVFETQHLKSISWNDVPEGWQVSLNPSQDTLCITAPSQIHQELVTCNLKLVLKGLDGDSIIQPFSFQGVGNFDNPKGAFVLNEGNMTTENGSLIYISPSGLIIPDIYKRINGSELGNVCQDMAFYGDKIYIISQNGNKNAVDQSFENDGMLVVLDARTLKKIDSYTNEDLKELNWPSHIAVLDEEHVYIRDNGVKEGDNGSGQIWRLNTLDRSLTLVKGSKGAPKSRFVKANDKLYTYLNGSFSTKLLEIGKEKDQAVSRTISFAVTKLYGLCATADGEIWGISQYMGSGMGGNGYIYYVDRLNDKLKLENVAQISEEPYVGSSGVALAASHDMVYYAYDTSICRIRTDQTDHGKTAEIAEEEVADLSEMDRFARELYNGLDINPETGQLFIQTIKGMGNFYQTNQIWVFDPQKGFAEPQYKFCDYTHFPAGTFFPTQNK